MDCAAFDLRFTNSLSDCFNELEVHYLKLGIWVGASLIGSME
jgi:hypothetical protein